LPRSVALFAWYFPPDGGGGVHRPLAFVRHGANLGWTVSVITRALEDEPRPSGRDLLGAFTRGVDITRVPVPTLRTAPRLFPRVGDGFPGVRSGLLAALAGARAARAAFAGRRPSAVLASGPPFHWFVAGYFAARWWRVPLVLDYRDEWTEFPFDFVSTGRADRAWERRCLRAAAAVIFTTRSQLEHQLQVFPELDRARAALIPNGWEPADFTAGQDGAEGADPCPGRAELSFIGHLGAWTLPGDFLAALGRVLERRSDLRASLQVSFVGAKHPVARRQLEAWPYQDVLALAPEVSKADAIRRMRASAALLLINEPRLSRYRPGKLYDYMATGQPIVVYGDGGEVAAVVRETGAGLIVPSADDARLAEVIDIVTRRAGSVDRSSRDAWLTRHRRDALVAETLGILARVADEAGPTTVHPAGGQARLWAPRGIWTSQVLTGAMRRALVDRLLPRSVRWRLSVARAGLLAAWERLLSADRRALARALGRVGVRPGSLVFVHSSFDQMRLIRATPLEVIGVLSEAVGEVGTVVMPAFPMSGRSQDYLDEGRVFDWRRTPSAAGLLTEVFRRMAGTERSLHPTHSVAARGRDARQVTQGHERSTLPFDEHSPFQRLLDRGADVLSIGAFSAMTFRHLADHLIQDRLPYPIYSGRPTPVRMIDGAGTEHRLVTQGHNPTLVCDYDAVLERLSRAGRVRRTTVGRVPLLRVSVRDYVAAYHQAQADGVVRYRLEGSASPGAPPRGMVDGA
jgi:aminoglycoside 3-N-acetyltransferase